MKRTVFVFVLCTLFLKLTVSGQESVKPPAGKKVVSPVPNVAFQASTTAAVPQHMTYQGVLTGPSGAPVTDGNYAFTIDLFSVSTGGVSAWTDNFTLPVARGAFTVILGSGAPLTIVFDKTYYLQLPVTGGPPRPPYPP